MGIDALIPVKAATAGKERLAQLLTPAERAALVRAMLHDVTAALLASGLLRRVAVTSPDAAMLALAERLGALPLPEPPAGGGLNAALAAAIARLAAGGADAVLIVQGDVPELSPADVAALVTSPTSLRSPLPAPCSPRQPASGCVRAAPSVDGGTSALLLRPADAIAPAFGAGSFARHQAAALAAGVTFERCDLPALAWDIDRPEDLARLLDTGRPGHTRDALLRLGLPQRLSGVPR